VNSCVPAMNRLGLVLAHSEEPKSQSMKYLPGNRMVALSLRLQSVIYNGNNRHGNSYGSAGTAN